MNKIVSEYMFDVATMIVETSFDNEREDAYVCVEDMSNDITIKRCILNKNTKNYFQDYMVQFKTIIDDIRFRSLFFMELKENGSLFTPHSIRVVEMNDKEVFHLDKPVNWKQVPFPE